MFFELEKFASTDLAFSIQFHIFVFGKFQCISFSLTFLAYFNHVVVRSALSRMRFACMTSELPKGREGLVAKFAFEIFWFVAVSFSVHLLVVTHIIQSALLGVDINKQVIIGGREELGDYCALNALISWQFILGILGRGLTNFSWDGLDSVVILANLIFLEIHSHSLSQKELDKWMDLVLYLLIQEFHHVLSWEWVYYCWLDG